MNTATTLRCALAALVLIACDEASPDPVICPAPAVEIALGGATWCAHHDVPRFTCPAHLPERGSYNDVAVCGLVRADYEIGLEVARAALRTGQVFERRTITAFEIPPEWRSAPGAPIDEPLEIPIATFAGDNVSWASDDGDPELCTIRFDHFEAPLAADGRTIVVTGWDRVTCGPDEVGMGAEIHETHPLSLPALAPGRYAFVSPRPRTGGAMPTAPLLVGLDALCPEVTPLGECFRGAFFADCGAAQPLGPQIWCEPGASSDCVWSQCPPAGHTAVDCTGDMFCPTPHVGWDDAPWDRARSMALAVVVDAALEAGATAVECMIESTDVELDRICGPAEAEWVTRRRPAPGDDRWGWPSMVALTASNVGELNLEGWALSVELDVFADGGPQARACLVHTSDGGAAGEPVCAADGTLTVDHLPDAPEAVADMRARLTAAFPDFPVHPDCDTGCDVRGLAIRAHF